jgi:two-component system phosphate regulon sensor histidine kinase PhoR
VSHWVWKRAVAIGLCLLLGAGIGAWLGETWWQRGLAGALAGALIASVCLLLQDTRRARQLLLWLRLDPHAQTREVRLPAMWRSLRGHVRRSWREQDKAVDTERRRFDRLLSAMQASPDGVLILDHEERIEWGNIAASTHFGLDIERDRHQHLVNLLRQPAFLDYLQRGEFGQGVHLPRRDGEGSLMVYVFRYGDQGDKLVLSRDITDIERVDQMRRDFVANVSHEIRTPLTVVSGFIETLSSLCLSEAEQRRYLGMMGQQAQRMQTLIDDLLVLARLEGSPLPPMDRWNDIGTMLAQAEGEARALSQGRHQLSFAAAEPAQIAGAASELASALTNLVGNAIRYTPSGGRIEVRWQPLADGSGEFYVRDDGPGIAREHLARLTERFYRLDRSRSRETGGTGLGLSIVKRVQTRHEGALLIESGEGEGSTFRLRYPAKRIRPADR